MQNPQTIEKVEPVREIRKAVYSDVSESARVRGLKEDGKEK